MITITKFSGMRPALEDKHLPQGAASVAVNCDFSRGDLRPMTGRLREGEIDSNGYGTPNYEPPTISFFRQRDVNYWLRFRQHVTVAGGFVPGDQATEGPVLFWTIEDPSPMASSLPREARASFPRCASVADIGAPTGVPPRTSRRIGVPEPEGFPFVRRVKISGLPLDGDVAERDPAYNYLYWAPYKYHPWLNKREQPLSGGLYRGTYLPSEMESPDSEASGVGYRSWAFTLVNEWDQEGMLSSPSEPILCGSPPNVEVSLFRWVVANVPSERMTRVKRIRFYRSASGATSSAWLLVGEVDLPRPGVLFRDESGNMQIVSAWEVDLHDPGKLKDWLNVGDLVSGPYFLDRVPDERLGARCSTEGFNYPRKGLRGMVALPNGFMAAHMDKEIHFSQPWMPYAWPAKYILPVDATVRSMKPMPGGGMFVGTDMYPYIIRGASPSAAVASRIDMALPCLDEAKHDGSSERWIQSTVVMDDGSVCYASNDGLVQVSYGGSASVISAEMFTPAQWRSLMQADRFHGFCVRGRYVCVLSVLRSHLTADLQVRLADFFVSGVSRIRVAMSMDLRRKDVVFAPYFPPPGHVSAHDGYLYFTDEHVGGGTVRLQAWNHDHAPTLRYRWQSPPIFVQRTSFAAVKVLANGYSTPLTGLTGNVVPDPGQPPPDGTPPNSHAWNTACKNAELVLTVLVDGVARFRSPIWGFGPWRLPAGFTGREWTIILEGTAPVQAVIIGGTE